MSDHKKANLFVVGAMRAGTTSFMEILSQHAEVYVSPIKEPHYFTDDLPEALYEKRPLFSLERYFKNEFPRPLHRAIIKKEADYERLFSLTKDEKFLAEGSVSYLHAPGTPKSIHAYNPNAKIIIITRDPLERLFSHYKMDVALLRQHSQMEALLSDQVKKYREGELEWDSHLAMSFYNERILEFKNYFKENVLVLSFESLVDSSPIVLETVTDFLEIAPFSEVEFPKKNETKKVRYRSSLSILKKMGLWQLLANILPNSFKNRAKKKIYTTPSKEMGLSDELYKELMAIFHKESFSPE